MATIGYLRQQVQQQQQRQLIKLIYRHNCQSLYNYPSRCYNIITQSRLKDHHIAFFYTFLYL